LAAGQKSPDAPERFYVYHADLGPTNIMISEDGSVSGVLDWESAGYYPEFWIATKPLVSGRFYLPQVSEDRMAWAKLLVNALEIEGFKPSKDKYQAWKNLVRPPNPITSNVVA
jgi:hypothetical protein